MKTTKRYLMRKILKPLGFNVEYYVGRPFNRFLKSTKKKDLVGIEIGVYDGWNSLEILETLPIKKLYLIDPYKSYDDYFENEDSETQKDLDKRRIVTREVLKKYKDKIVFVYDFSEKAVEKINEEVDFVYIDGNHEYSFVKKDIELYFPKVKKGGLIGGHDYNFSPETEKKHFGVVKAVQEFFKGKTVYFHDWDWWTTK